MIATEWNLGTVLWAMLVFFFWFMAIWIFITIFADIFRRRDLSGWAKAGWILLIFIVPFLGALIYLIARPKMTEQDKEDMERMQETQRRVAGVLPRRRGGEARQAPRRGQDHGRGVRGHEEEGDDADLASTERRRSGRGGLRPPLPPSHRVGASARGTRGCGHRRWGRDRPLVRAGAPPSRGR